MKTLLLSMPDVAPVIMHESAFHMPNLGIASIGANIDAGHEIYIVDLVRNRRGLKKHLIRRLTTIKPDLVGLSSMTWQYPTCIKIIRLIKKVRPAAKIVLGGYHATLMAEEITSSDENPEIDFLVRGEGEEAFRRLINALTGQDRLEEIPSLSYKNGQGFVHNPKGELLDLARLKLPIRDKRRLTWGYHIMNRKVEVMETSRGCTRNCNFCSIRHMYGRAFRPFPIERILADIDDIYYNCKTRMIFVSDDNLVLDPTRVIRLCDAIIAREYKNLSFVVQADCVTISRNEGMVAKMARAGFKIIFLGVENASKKNLIAAQKGDILNASKQAIKICHKYGVMVVGGMIFGFPDDGEEEIMENYRLLKSTGADTTYCQILTPYPKTGIRKQLLDQELITNRYDYSRYNGMWANIRTRKLSSAQLQYLFWYHNERIMGWWTPSQNVQAQGRLWTSIWLYAVKPLLKVLIAHQQKKLGWQGRFEKAICARAKINLFSDLDDIE
jgi:radical SAM superfamily enzyme YgiQ (UPF0313 family)